MSQLCNPQTGRLWIGIHTATRQKRVPHTLGNGFGDLPDLVHVAAQAQPVTAFELIRKVQRKQIVGVGIPVRVRNEPAPLQFGKRNAIAVSIYWEHQTEFFLAQSARIHARMAGIFCDEAQIELAVQDPRQDGMLGCGLDLHDQLGGAAHDLDNVWIEQCGEAA